MKAGKRSGRIRAIEFRWTAPVPFPIRREFFILCQYLGFAGNWTTTNTIYCRARPLTHPPFSSYISSIESGSLSLGLLFFIPLLDEEMRNKLWADLNSKKLGFVLHQYSVAFIHQRITTDYKEVFLPLTESKGERLFSQPSDYDLQRQEQEFIIGMIHHFFCD